MSERFLLDTEFERRSRVTSAEAKERLRADLLAHGCVMPLIVWREQKLLLDGYVRHELCQELNIPFEIKELSFPSREEAAKWVARNELGWRTIPPMARVELALNLESDYEGKVRSTYSEIKAEGFEKQEITFKQINLDRETAKVARVTSTSVLRVRELLEQATLELIEAVRLGKISIGKAWSTATGKPLTRSNPKPRPKRDPLAPVQHPSDAATAAAIDEMVSHPEQWETGRLIDDPMLHELRKQADRISRSTSRNQAPNSSLDSSLPEQATSVRPSRLLPLPEEISCPTCGKIKPVSEMVWNQLPHVRHVLLRQKVLKTSPMYDPFDDARCFYALVDRLKMNWTTDHDKFTIAFALRKIADELSPETDWHAPIKDRHGNIVALSPVMNLPPPPEGMHIAMWRSLNHAEAMLAVMMEQKE